MSIKKCYQMKTKEVFKDLKISTVLTCLAAVQKQSEEVLDAPIFI